MSIPQDVRQSVDYLRDQGFADEADVTIILGSGLGDFAGQLQDARSLDYRSIPGMPEPGVAGHQGLLYYGYIRNQRVLAFSGRFHRYEGHAVTRTLLPVQIGCAMGSQLALISNAAGGIAHRLRVGELMLIDDLMRFGGGLVAGSEAIGSPYRFHNDVLVESAQSIAHHQGIAVQRGCYMYMKGPSYETPAEIRALQTMGADAVGMSTAPELIEAWRLNMKCMGVSLITNKAAGIAGTKLDHSDIKQVAEQSKEAFSRLFTGFIEQL